MEKVRVKATITFEGKSTIFEGEGNYDQKKGMIEYRDQEDTITFLLKEQILVKETKETILSSKFKVNALSNFEIYAKRIKRSGILPLQTKKLDIQENEVTIVYQIEGNMEDHHYHLEWRML